MAQGTSPAWLLLCWPLCRELARPGREPCGHAWTCSARRSRGCARVRSRNRVSKNCRLPLRGHESLPDFRPPTNSFRFRGRCVVSLPDHTGPRPGPVPPAVPQAARPPAPSSGEGEGHCEVCGLDPGGEGSGTWCPCEQGRGRPAAPLGRRRKAVCLGALGCAQSGAPFAVAHPHLPAGGLCLPLTFPGLLLCAGSTASCCWRCCTSFPCPQN